MPSPSPAPVLVFDLDGTILGINSFPRWAAFLLTGPIVGLGAGARLRLSYGTAVLLARRKLRRMTHDAFQRGLGLLWHDAWRQAQAGDDGSAAIGRFKAGLQAHVRPGLRPLLQVVAVGRLDAVMATAATADYAVPLGLDLGFRHVLATPCQRGPGDPINFGMNKRDRVRALLSQNAWQDREIILFTDHIDDLPLMADSRLVCWFGPPRPMEVAQQQAADVRFVPCRGLTGERILALVVSAVAAPPPDVQAAAAWWSRMASL